MEEKEKKTISVIDTQGHLKILKKKEGNCQLKATLQIKTDNHSSSMSRDLLVKATFYHSHHPN